MAAPSYTTDLVDIITDPAATTGWTLISSGGGGASSFTAPETDDYIQSASPGTLGCISRNPWTSVSIRGMVYNSAQTIAAGNAVFIWAKSDVAQALDTRVNGGLQALIGNATTALKAYYVDGSDSYAFGGWKCYAIDPTITQSTSIGTPTSVTDYFGFRWSVPVSGPSKGFPYKIDAIRRGRTLTLTAGDLANGYATFTGVATFQGDLSRQWGLFQFQNGSYLQQGNFQMGTSGAAVDFRDSNRAIAVADTLFVQSGFNRFEVNNVSSRVDWTNISISALGTVSRGNFEMINAADVNFETCTFTDMGTFIFLSTAGDIGSTYRRCLTVTPNGGSFTNSTFTNTQSSTGAITLAAPSDIANMTDCIFSANTVGPAIQITNAGNYNFVGHSFSGNTTQVSYTGISALKTITTATSTGTELTFTSTAHGYTNGTNIVVKNVISSGPDSYNNAANEYYTIASTTTDTFTVAATKTPGTYTSGGIATIPCLLIPSGGSNVAFASSVATQTNAYIVVATPAVNVTLTGLKSGSEVRAYLGTNPATSVEIGGTETSGTSFTFSQAYGGQDGYIQIFSLQYQPVFLYITYSALDQSIPIQQVIDRQYDPGSV